MEDEKLEIVKQSGILGISETCVSFSTFRSEVRGLLGYPEIDFVIIYYTM